MPPALAASVLPADAAWTCVLVKREGCENMSSRLERPPGLFPGHQKLQKGEEHLREETSRLKNFVGPPLILCGKSFFYTRYFI